MRDARIDCMRLCGNLAICATHAYPFMYAVGHDAEFWFWSFFSMNFCLMAMPGFFLMSGYLFFWNLNRGYASKLLSRVKRLLIPLLIWNLFACAFFFAFSFIHSKVHSGATELDLFCLAGWMKQALAFDVLANPPLWYLRAVFVFALLSPLLLFVYKRFHWLVVVLLCVVVVSVCPRLSRADYPIYGSMLYALGGLAAYKNFNIFDYTEKHWRVALLWSATIVTASCCYNYLRNDVAQPSPLLKFCGALTFLVVGILFSRYCGSKRFFKWISPTCFMIYVGHGILNPYCMHFLGGILPAGYGKMSVIAILTMGCTIFSFAFLWYFLNRFAPKFLRVIDGRM